MVHNLWTELYIVLLLLAAVVIISQCYITYLFHKYEQAKIWKVIGILFPLGLNIYIYQIIKLEKRLNNFLQIASMERRDWRTAYLLVLAQYLLLFAVFGLFASP
ncbi:MAG: hypothetical protein ACQEWU_01965 [Bacillota bacterium]|uniref:Uncharacterized protein n=1 Tax=Virgibacillus salarius TaxID=447199 RepID=A0A941I7Z0_9BACI|nr:MULTISPECIES: hypothetical protein [Bacillaceae]NAZ07752.1 hypothetical protein [Agaribacter marinus]MBR7795034.1 hypothetical protein [Virgibacillus salarius]MCC2248461.1 hypothetical protein [Virgibacillus sp. AGTR]MDY7043104.1 hypothetical protein [Virgibacillus sp. M23]QRZ16674.1 hypothetical protein JUJ52_12770 [Virgibacillus sp. AGTR]